MGRLLAVGVILCACTLFVYADEGVENYASGRFVASLIDHLNSVPGRVYLYEDGILVSANKKGDHNYEVEANVKALDPSDFRRYKLLNCHGNIREDTNYQPSALTVIDSSGCSEVGPTAPSVAVAQDTAELDTAEDEEVTEQQRAVRLDHEVLPSNQVTSGEQFVAVRREPSVPGGGSCAGCSSFVDTEAPGVDELARLALRHLDRHDQTSRHTLGRISTVERQVQVVNGVRYVLTLDVSYDNCTPDIMEDCMHTKTCRVSILEKPWLKLPGGSKFRAILSNNCTDEYLFGDNGEVLPAIVENPTNNQDNEIDVNFNPDEKREGTSQPTQPTPDYDAIANSGTGDDILKAVHNTQLQAGLPTKERELTADELKTLEEQIIPSNKKVTIAEETMQEEVSKTNGETNAVQKITNEQMAVAPKQSSLSADKQEALDGLMDFFNFDKDKSERQKRTVDKADESFVHNLANLLVDTLNNFDSHTKRSTLQEVLSADEETIAPGKHIFYIRAKILFSVNGAKDEKPTIKICNAMIDVTTVGAPRVMKSLCHKARESRKLGERQQLDRNSPEVLQIAKQALEKIEDQNTYDTKLKLLNILSVDKQIMSGTVTRLSVEIGITNCPKSDSVDVSKCNIRSDHGTTICKIQSHHKPWLKSNKISFECTQNEDVKLTTSQRGSPQESEVNDPEIVRLARQSLQHFELTSARDNRLKIVKIHSASTQVVSGYLTKILYDIAFTKCMKSDTEVDIDSCELLENSPKQRCHAEIWNRPWLKDNKSINVACKKVITEIITKERSPENAIRVQRSLLKNDLIGGPVEQNPENFKSEIKDSLNYLEQLSENRYKQKVVNITSLTTQIVSGIMTKIDFEVGYTKCMKNELTAPEDCELLEDQPTRHCHSEVWNRPWIKDGKQITVTCDKDSKSRQKRNTCGLAGGICRIDLQPEHLQLAQESLQKLEQLSDSQYKQKIVNITSVTTQVVAGTLTKIDFNVAYTKCMKNEISENFASDCDLLDNNTIKKCHSEVWNRPWIKDGKQITVTCDTDSKSRQKRNTCGLAGGICRIDIQPEHLQLAQESLQKLEQLSDSPYRQKIVNITSVTTQVVTGTLTKIDFHVAYTKCMKNEISKNVDSECELDYNTIKKCRSEVWNRPWIKDGKQITVTCDDFRKAPIELEVDTSPIKSSRRARESYLSDDIGPNDIKAAEMAVSILQTRGVGSGNKLKLVNIKTLKRTLNSALIRMHIDVGLTVCEKDDDIDPSICPLMDQIPHWSCHVEVWRRRSESTKGKDVSIYCDNDLPGMLYFTPDQGWRVNPDYNKVQTRKHAQLALEKLKTSGPKFKVIKIISYLSLEDDDNSKIIVFIAAPTNCSSQVPLSKFSECKVNTDLPISMCQAIVSQLHEAEYAIVCDHTSNNEINKKKRSYTTSWKVDHMNTVYQLFAKQALIKLDLESESSIRQKLHKVTLAEKLSEDVRRIEFEVSYTKCSKYDGYTNISECEPLPNPPHRFCKTQIWRKSWLNEGFALGTTCKEKDPIDPEDYDVALQLADWSLKHIQAKYPHPSKINVVRILSIDRQVATGFHYRVRYEVGFTDCLAFDDRRDCNMSTEWGKNMLCKANVWLRDQPEAAPNVRVSCDREGETINVELYRELQAQKLFDDFLTKNERNYKHNNTQRAERYTIFKNNVKRIHELNTHERGTARYGITQFADMTYQEFIKMRGGMRPDLKNDNLVPHRKAIVENDRNLPESFDWRDRGAVTKVKDQGQCGSCWAFSVTGNIEGQYKIATNKLLSLSEQELVDCDTLDEGCNGGLPDNAYRAIEKIGGLENETDYPYDAQNEQCKFKPNRVSVQITGAVNISSDEQQMANWLYKKGPISIGINANGMQFYMGGVSHPWKIVCNPKSIDHGVLIVGYGVKDYPLFHKKLPYWIVKNSWGPSWGESGYYRVYRGDGTCGVNTMASSAIVANHTSFDLDVLFQH